MKHLLTISFLMTSILSSDLFIGATIASDDTRPLLEDEENNPQRKRPRTSHLSDQPLKKLMAAAIEGDQESQDEILTRYEKGLMEEGVQEILNPLSWKRQQMLFAAAIESDQKSQAEILTRYDKGLMEEGMERMLNPLLSWKRQKTEDLTQEDPRYLILLTKTSFEFPDEIKARIHELAQADVPWAQYLYAIFCYRDPRQDEGIARQWNQKAAEQGYAPAQFKLGEKYEEGEMSDEEYTSDEDMQQARYWYQKAAEQGHVAAQHSLGLHYYIDKEFGLALPWLMKAAEQGDASAHNHIGHMYQDGNVVEKDDIQAFKCFWKAQTHGHFDDSSSIRKYLGTVNNTGNLNNKDLEESIKTLHELRERLEASWGLGFGLNASGFIDSQHNPDERDFYGKMFGFGSNCLTILQALKQPGFMVKFTNNLSPFNYSDVSKPSALRCYPALENLACIGEEAVKVGDLLYSMLHEDKHPNHLTFASAKRTLQMRGRISHNGLIDLKGKAESVDSQLWVFKERLKNKAAQEASHKDYDQLAEQYRSLGYDISPEFPDTPRQEIERLLRKKVDIRDAIKKQTDILTSWRKQLQDIMLFENNLKETLLESIHIRNELFKQQYPQL